MNSRFHSPRSPVLLEQAFDDPEAVSSLVRKNAPYWPVLRYVAKPEEFEAVSRSRPESPRILPPWFRGDWADDKPLVPGAEAVLDNPNFAKAARQLFQAEVVSPVAVYVNLMAPLPFAGEGHIDVPAFRGIDRRRFPIWLLQQMTRSGLFADFQIDMATAVSWFYAGEGGAFDYWAKGPDEAPLRVESPFGNRAVVGDNDFMFHRVDAIGQDAKMIEASLEAELEPAPDDARQWIVVEEGRELARYDDSDIRVSVSWKAEVFEDENAYRIRAEHRDDLTLDSVIDRFLADFADRGTPIPRPADPLRDSEFIRALSDVYRLPELVYPSEAETNSRRAG